MNTLQPQRLLPSPLRESRTPAPRDKTFTTIEKIQEKPLPGPRMIDMVEEAR